MLAKTLEKQKLKLSCSALLHMKTRVSLKYFVTGCCPQLKPEDGITYMGFYNFLLKYESATLEQN